MELVLRIPETRPSTLQLDDGSSKSAILIWAEESEENDCGYEYHCSDGDDSGVHVDLVNLATDADGYGLDSVGVVQGAAVDFA